LFIFKPTYYQAGTYTVTFVATDNANPPLSDFENVVITVVDVNRPPTVDSIPPQNVAVGDTLRLRVVGTDSTDWNGGPLYMTATNLPVNSTFSDSGGGIGKFRFVPASSQIGVYTVTFMCTDAEVPALTGVRNVTINVITGANKPPVLNPIGWKSVREADTLRFNISASDPDGTIPALYTGTLPRNAVFVDSGNGRGSFTFRPDYAQQGLKQVTFYASDGSLIDYENVLIQVIDAGNQRPILRSIPPDSVMEGDSLKILVHADDPDSTIPHLSSGTLPVNASFVDSGNGNGVLTFKPVYVQAGVYGMVFTASDGSLADTESVLITVLEAGNQPPNLVIPFDSTTMDENTTLSFRVRGFDPDSTIPILRATDLPANATFTDSLNGRGGFRFSSSYFQAGTYNIYFLAIDSQDTSIVKTDTVKIVVKDVNQPPSFGVLSTQSTREGRTLVVAIKAVDKDSTMPSLSMVTQLQNATFSDSGNGTGVFTFSPVFNQGNQNPNVYGVTFRAIDQVYPDTVFSNNMQIYVYDSAMPPEIRPINDTSVVEGGTLAFFVWASDPDSTILTLSAFNLPLNSSFNIVAGSLGRFSFNPNFCQAGIYTVGFVARDNTSLVDTVLVRVTVTDAGNHKPKLASISDKTAAAGDLLSFTISATDSDCTIPQLLADSLPRNAVFHDSANGKGLFRFTPDSTQIDSTYSVIFIASDGSLADSARVHISVIAYIRGDANRDGRVTVADVVYLVGYLFKGGPAPVPLGAGDANRDGKITVEDCVYLINFLFKGGPPP